MEPPHILVGSVCCLLYIFYLLSTLSLWWVQLLEARATLSQHPKMLQELNEWVELECGRELLQHCSASLKGHRVSVCNVQLPRSWINGVITSLNFQTKVRTSLLYYIRLPRQQLAIRTNPSSCKRAP